MKMLLRTMNSEMNVNNAHVNVNTGSTLIENAPPPATTNDSNDSIQEIKDPYSYDAFCEFEPNPGWFKIKAVRVHSIYRDFQENKLYLFLIDRNRDKVVAIIDSNLVSLYASMTLEGHMFSIKHFQFMGLGNLDFPRYKAYSIHRDFWELWITKKTEFTPLNNMDINFELPFYPKLPTLRTLLDDTSRRRMLIDVVGKIVRGKLIKYVQPWRPAYVKFVLKDLTGKEMKMKLYGFRWFLPIPLARAIYDNAVIYMTRVKLVHSVKKNYLVCTDLTKLEFNPNMQETEDLMLL